jgi:sterol desaturase/sphingolipid hydroxylase (fatty acid hydroxylase superfamily)
MRDDSVVTGARPPRSDLSGASPPLFAWKPLDRLTRVHPAVPPTIFVPAIALLASLGSGDLRWASYLLALAGGYVFWTLCEYWGHRAVFHFEPEGGVGARLHWMIHGVHHDHPNDPMRLVLPPAFSLPLAGAFWFLFVAALGSELGSAACAGFFAGYLLYDMLHFALHHSRPKSRLGRWLRELHMRHHFEDDERGFGVSVPYWDIVFGTYTRRRNRVAHARS